MWVGKQNFELEKERNWREFQSKRCRPVGARQSQSAVNGLAGDPIRSALGMNVKNANLHFVFFRDFVSDRKKS